ncbi:heme-binding protein [Parasphingorhabdus sp. JC815]|uniref:GlcG/HbpS family heme-binding protein n=1 Tax=Parasphingorhabdus sp. JC815 TaxID=3232140 RepID=UPI0034589A51
MISFKPVLTAAIVRTALEAAIAAAQTEQHNMSVAIVDEGGYLFCLQRMDNAGLMTPKVAGDKARTAALLRAPSRMLADRVTTDVALLRLTDYLPMAGGLPIIIQGHCVGAIGVSGGTPEQDERVGQAGLAALQLD